MGAPTPPPGPSTTALFRRSARNSAKSCAPSTGRTITARLAAAFTSSASRGLAMVTSPAPARSAPRAASRAAPVDDNPPDTTTAWPRAYLCPSRTRHRKALRPQIGGALTKVCGLMRSKHACGNADVGDVDAPAMAAARAAADVRACGGRTSPFSAAVHRDPHDRAGGAVDAARQIDGVDAAAGPALIASISARASPSTGRSRPAPNSASTIASAGASAAGDGRLDRARSSGAPPARHRP